MSGAGRRSNFIRAVVMAGPARRASLVLGLVALCLSSGWTRAEAPAPPGARALSEGDGSQQAREHAHRARREEAERARKKRAKKKRAKKKRSHRGKKGRSRRSRGVRDLATEWHALAEAEECEALADAPDGSWGLMSLGAKTCFAIPPLGDEPPDEIARARARHAFVDKRRGATHEIDPRLLRVLERAVREFEVPYIHLVSGYRPGRSASRHAHGLAADVVFPGVTNRQLARFMRQQGFMGVGIYMRTGFVHVDLRERSYFWLDWSPPGKKWRGKPILMAEAREADEAAEERGETPFEAPEALADALEKRKARKARAEAARARRRAAAKKRAKARRRAAAKKRRRERAAQQQRRAAAQPEAPAQP